MRLKTIVAVAALAAAMFALPATAAAAAPAPDDPPSTGPLPVCVPTVPGVRIELTLADNGRTICVQPGHVVAVTLVVDPKVFPDPANWWTPVQASGRSLVEVPLPAVPPPGTTAAVFRAVRPGQAVLTSAWSICPPLPSPPCGAPVRLWQVTVDVSWR